jgi:hypothetical protein
MRAVNKPEKTRPPQSPSGWKARTTQPKEKQMIGKDVLVRTYSAGVHVGTLKSRDGKEVVLTNARRVWYWDGAATLSQLAMEGTSKPENCKFPCPVNEILLTDAIEIIPITDKARESIAGVKVWAK